MRVKEGQHINKSLFFLTQVIALKAEMNNKKPTTTLLIETLSINNKSLLKKQNLFGAIFFSDFNHFDLRAFFSNFSHHSLLLFISQEEENNDREHYEADYS